MSRAPSPATSQDAQGQGASYHRAPPSRPESLRISDLLTGALLGGAAAAAWFATQERIANALAPLRVPGAVVRHVTDGLLASRMPLAAALGVLGTVFLLQGVLALLAASRRSSRAGFRPRPGWAREWPWDPDRVDDPRMARCRARLHGFLVSAAVLGPFPWPLWSKFRGEPETAAPLLVAWVWLSAVPAAELLLAAGWWLAAAFKGRGTLLLHQFPFAIGAKLEARYVPTSAIAKLGPRMKATLRCLEVDGAPSGGRIPVRERWRWTEDVEVGGGGGEIVIQVSASPDLSTQFRKPARFWELEVGPRAQGAAENARFIVPVYADPARPVRSTSSGGTDRRPASQQLAAAPPPAAPAPAKKPATAVPARRPATSPPAAPAPAPARRGPSDAPAPARKPATSPPAPQPPPEPAVTPPGRLSELLPEEGSAPEAPGDERSAFHTPFPPRPVSDRPPEKFRVELFLTPALAVEDLGNRIASAFQVQLAPLPGAEEGSWFGRAEGLAITLSVTAEGRRLLLGGSMPLDPGPGTPSERAADWAIQALMHAGVAARRPT